MSAGYDVDSHESLAYRPAYRERVFFEGDSGGACNASTIPG